MIIERGYLDHWKTALLRQRTERPDAAEIPIRLWEYCESRMDDFIEDKDGTVLAAICRWSGKVDVLLSALIECRWIEKTRGNRSGWLVRGWRDRQRGHFSRKLNGAKSLGRPKKSASGSQSETENNRPVNSGAEKETEANLPGGRVEESRVEESRVPLPSPDRGPDADGLSASKALPRILKIFGRSESRRLSYEAEHALSRFLPIAEKDMAALEWFYARPADPKSNELSSRHRSAEKLIINLGKAIDEAYGFAKKSGRPGTEKKERRGPAGWQEWHRAKFPEMPVPAAFAALPDYLQEEAAASIAAAGAASTIPA